MPTANGRIVGVGYHGRREFYSVDKNALVLAAQKKGRSRALRENAALPTPLALCRCVSQTITTAIAKGKNTVDRSGV